MPDDNPSFFSFILALIIPTQLCSVEELATSGLKPDLQRPS